jgi:hypothetical protein
LRLIVRAVMSSAGFVTFAGFTWHLEKYSLEAGRSAIEVAAVSD